MKIVLPENRNKWKLAGGVIQFLFWLIISVAFYVGITDSLLSGFSPDYLPESLYWIIYLIQLILFLVALGALRRQIKRTWEIETIEIVDGELRLSTESIIGGGTEKTFYNLSKISEFEKIPIMVDTESGSEYDFFQNKIKFYYNGKSVGFARDISTIEVTILIRKLNFELKKNML